MKNIKYLIQFIFFIFLFGMYKLLGLKLSLITSGFIFSILGPIFRSNKVSKLNLSYAFKNNNESQNKKILKIMWKNYGKIFAEYMFIKEFRNNSSFSDKISLENNEILDKIKKEKEPVIFVSGHFNNFEFMAMEIEKFGIDLCALYRPLNNIFLNPMMEKIRKKYICKNQIKKGISGTKNLLKSFRNKTSIALMIDQRVTQGIGCNFFGRKASTTTIPAQFVKKFNAKIVPVYIERENNTNFKITFQNPMEFSKDANIEMITTKLNKLLEDMILKNPDQWIWSHNRWK